MLLVFLQDEADYACILPHLLQYEADSSANLPLILLYEADHASILLHLLKYDADSVAILDEPIYDVDFFFGVAHCGQAQLDSTPIYTCSLIKKFLVLLPWDGSHGLRCCVRFGGASFLREWILHEDGFHDLRCPSL